MNKKETLKRIEEIKEILDGLYEQSPQDILLIANYESELETHLEWIEG